jgi:hypothetical protein
MNKKELLSAFEGFFEELGLHKNPGIREGVLPVRPDHPGGSDSESTFI